MDAATHGRRNPSQRRRAIRLIHGCHTQSPWPEAATGRTLHMVTSAVLPGDIIESVSSVLKGGAAWGFILPPHDDTAIASSITRSSDLSAPAASRPASHELTNIHLVGRYYFALLPNDRTALAIVGCCPAHGLSSLPSYARRAPAPSTSVHAEHRRTRGEVGPHFRRT